MLAVLPYRPDRGSEPVLGELPDPVVQPGEVLVEVRASALNRADLLQLRGLYPPPPGESEIPGLECAGVILETGRESGGTAGPWRAGDRVMALLAGGGHAERVAVPAGQLMPIPAGMSFEQAAAVPEAALTAWTNLVAEAALEPGERVLITGASGGVGSFAVQLARELGAEVYGAARDLERLRRAGVERPLADDESLARRLDEATGGRGVDVVLDLASGANLASRLEALADRGRLILVGLMAGTTAEIDLAGVLRRRLSLRGSVLRPRSRTEKAQLVSGFREFAGARLADGRLRPVVHASHAFAEIAAAYAALGRGGVAGKIVVSM